MKIPIENIYYLLSYAWDKLDERDRVQVNIESKTDVLNLLSKVLINGSRILLKRGLDKSYNNFRDEINGVKGKLELSDTLKSNLHLKLRTICSFDEFSHNITTNKIIFSTLSRLIKTEGVSSELKNELKEIIRMLDGVDIIELKPSIFKCVRLNRNNKFYGFLLNVCELIYQNTLPSGHAGEWIFKDFTRDERKMNRLFEEFVRNFYKREQSDYPSVRREIIKWQVDVHDNLHLKFLPQMETDITLENDNSKIIIDTKYYSETMALNYEKEKIHSSNLYQLFSYLINQRTDDPKTKRTTGILLYPSVNQNYDLKYNYEDHEIHIKTLNLNQNWKKIDERLRDIIQDTTRPS